MREDGQCVGKDDFPDAAKQGDQEYESKDEQVPGSERAGENDQDDTEDICDEDQGEQPQAKRELLENRQADCIQERRRIHRQDEPDMLLDRKIGARQISDDPDDRNHLQEPCQHAFPQVARRPR